MGIQLNDLERKILEEIQNGKTEFLYKRIELDVLNGVLPTIWILRNFGFIDSEDFTSESEIGMVDVSLKEEGKRLLMNEDELKLEIQKQIEEILK